MTVLIAVPRPSRSDQGTGWDSHLLLIMNCLPQNGRDRGQYPF
jgi:hypothetical protein